MRDGGAIVRWTRLTAVAAVLAATGCASRGPEGVLAGEGPRMTELFRGSEEPMPAADRREPCVRRWWRPWEKVPERCLARGGEAGTGSAEEYTRTALNELELLFPRLPNPDVLIYVYPHLATEERVPVPGYTTAVPLYARPEYALPGEMPGEAREAEGSRAMDAAAAAGVEAAEARTETARLADELEAALGAMGEAASTAEKEAARLDEVAATVATQGESVENLRESVEALQVEADREEAGPEAAGGGITARAPESGLAGLSAGTAAEDGGAGFAVRGPAEAGVCSRVEVRPGSLRSNAERLAATCGYQLGSWPREREHAEYFSDWVVTKGYEAEVRGVAGLVDLVEAYGELKCVGRDRERVVDFAWEEP